MRKCIVFFALLILTFTAPTALTWHEDINLQGVQSFFSDLKRAYETEDINLFLSLYAPYSSTTDMVRNTDFIYTKDLIRSELELSFESVSGLQADFSEMEILTEGTMAMVRTLRTLKAEETPFINVKIVYTLQKKSPGWGYGWGNQRWEIISQVLLDEWYDFTFSDLKSVNTPYINQDTSNKTNIGHQRNPQLF